MKHLSLRTTLITLIVLVGSLFVGRWALQSYQNAQKTASAQKLQIVASTNVWGDIASQVGGDNVEVTSILSDPEADPHLFETDAKTASQIAQAELIIINGLGYDEFMDKLLAAAPQNQNVLTVSEVLKVDKDANPHLWYDLPRIQEVAMAIQDQLIKLDPAHTTDYQHNTQAFIAELQPLVAKLTPQQGGIAYTERVAGYLIEDLGLTNMTPTGFSESVESGTEPTPQQVTEFDSILSSGNVKVLLYNNQTTNDITEQLKTTAEQAGVTVVGVSETIPKGKNFQSWQLAQLNAILKAL